MARRSTFGIMLLASWFGAAAVMAAAPVAPAAAPDRPLRVATTVIAPFVLPNTNPLAGFSVDLWNEIARRMHVEFSWTVLPAHAALIPAVQRGEADLAIAALTMTQEREKLIDFSHPYFDSGLQILVRAHDTSPFLEGIRSIPWTGVGQLAGVAVLILFVLANVLWLIERRGNLNFKKGYIRSVGEGLWGTILIIATGEHGDRDAANVIKRVAVACMWLLGVVLIAQLTATVTSTQTVRRLQSNIQGPSDLPGKKIATVPGTTAADYLTQHGLPYVDITGVDDGVRMLTQGDVEAIVYDAPTLQYWAATRSDSALQVVGHVFRPEKYGIALPEGSPLRKPINEALLALYDDGTYETIHARWFSRGK